MTPSADRAVRKLSFAIRAAAAAILVWCAAVEVFGIFMRSLFGFGLDGDWFLVLAASGPGEVSAFIGMYWPQIALAAAAFAVLAAALVFLAFRIPRRRAPVALAAFAVYVAASACLAGSLKAWKPLYMVYDTVRFAGRYRALARAGLWTPERQAAVRPAPPGASNLVFVVGESLAASRVRFYGYEKDTMPRMAALGCAAMPPLRADHPFTARALADMMCDGAATLPVKYRLAGYRTVLASAQDRWERYAGVAQTVFAACEEKIYTSGEGPGADAALVPAVRRVFAGRKAGGRPVALFVHMIGSHFPPSARLPAGFAAGSGFDDYDRTVLYTDSVLADIVSAMPPDTLFVFVSDHGESPGSGRWRDASSEELWQVPFLVLPRERMRDFVGVTRPSQIRTRLAP